MQLEPTSLVSHIGSAGTAQRLQRNLLVSKIGTELQHAQVQLRLVTFLLTGSMLFDFLDPAILILSTASSLAYRVASMTGSPGAIAWALIALAVLGMLPYLVMQLICHDCPARREVTRLACLSLLVGAVLWFFLSWTAGNSGLLSVAFIFARTGGGAFMFSLALALTLNSELARQLLERPQ